MNTMKTEELEQFSLGLDLEPVAEVVGEFFAQDLHTLKANSRRWQVFDPNQERTYPPEWETLLVERSDGLTFSGVRRGRWIFIVSKLFDGCCELSDVKQWKHEDRPDFDPFEWREKLNNRVKSLELEEWRGRFSELHERLINWGRWTRQANGLGVSPIVEIMKDLGYKPEFIDEKTAPIDYRDAEEVQGAYRRLKEGCPEREYLALSYCNGFISRDKITKALHCPKRLIKELEDRSMRAIYDELGTTRMVKNELDEMRD